MLQTLARPKSQAFPSLEAPIRLITTIQRADGAIPWFADGIWDSWNHVECAMALEVAGELKAADRAYDYLVTSQAENGAWYCEYGNTAAMVDELYMSRETAGSFYDTNFAAYCATGIWHRYLHRQDANDLRHYWPMVRKAIDFVLTLQSDWGDIAWSSEAVEFGPDDSVRAGNASIRKSLECAIRIAFVVRDMKRANRYRRALLKLDIALERHAHRFDRSGDDRSMYAMDWYYPAMCGVHKGHEATKVLSDSWTTFVKPELGCHCVSTEPWITVAESAELAITLTSLGGRDLARNILQRQFNHRDDDGCFWMGYQYEEDIFWPREKPSWTQAAMVLAVETLRSGSPTACVLGQHL